MYIGNYLLSIQTLVLLFSCLAVILTRPTKITWSLATIVPLFVLILFCFLGVALRWPVESYFLSLSLFFILSFLCLGTYFVEINPAQTNRIARLLCCLVFCDAIARNLLSFDMAGANPFLHVRTSSYFEYERPAFVSKEPSYLAFSLCFFRLTAIYARRHFNGATKLLLDLAILATASLAGYCIWLYIIVVEILENKFRLNKESYFKIFLGTSLISILIFATPLFDYIYFRGARLFEAWSLNTLAGSEMNRLGGALVAYDYWSTESASNILFGLGYANYEHWLVARFGYIELEGHISAFGLGVMNSLLFSNILSIGIVGSLLFLWVLYRAVGLVFLGYLFFYMLLFGEMVTALLWGQVLIWRVLRESAFSHYD